MKIRYSKSILLFVLVLLLVTAYSKRRYIINFTRPIYPPYKGTICEDTPKDIELQTGSSIPKIGFLNTSQKQHTLWYPNITIWRKWKLQVGNVTLYIKRIPNNPNWQNSGIPVPTKCVQIIFTQIE